jgi:hypothetical protein
MSTVLCDMGLGLEMVLRCEMQMILMRFQFLIVSAVANPCEIIHQFSSLICFLIFHVSVLFIQYVHV